MFAPELGQYRHDYLRVVFERDEDGNVVKTDEGMRSVAAVERVSGGAVVETLPVNPQAPLEEGTTGEPAVETVLLEA